MELHAQQDLERRTKERIESHHRRENEVSRYLAEHDEFVFIPEYRLIIVKEINKFTYLDYDHFSFVFLGALPDYFKTSKCYEGNPPADYPAYIPLKLTWGRRDFTSHMNKFMQKVSAGVLRIEYADFYSFAHAKENQHFTNWWNNVLPHTADISTGILGKLISNHKLHHFETSERLRLYGSYPTCIYVMMRDGIYFDKKSDTAQRARLLIFALSNWNIYCACDWDVKTLKTMIICRAYLIMCRESLVYPNPNAIPSSGELEKLNVNQIFTY